MLSQLMLRHLIEQGTLQLITAHGKRYSYGTGMPRVTIQLHNRWLEWSLGFDPDLKLGEAYMRGTLTVKDGSLRDLLYLFFLNYERVKDRRFFRWLKWLNGTGARLPQSNPLGVARRNVSRHYDLPDQLYDWFLDTDRQYSCAYFTDPANSLEQAQADKKQHIAAKLFLNRPNLRVLDIGSGWGGLGLTLVRNAGAQVTGITLSANQHRYSLARAAAAGLSQQCSFQIADYRTVQGCYDRIVSVGMFEHVGKRNYRDFFDRIARLLTDDGVCLLHSISRYGHPEQTNGFIRKYIFPGGDIPALSEILEVAHASGLYVADIEILRLHYAETLKRWQERFLEHKHAAIAAYGAEFFRQWHFYLVASEMSFRFPLFMVAQLQLVKQITALPITRDYIHDWEQIQRRRGIMAQQEQVQARHSRRN